MNEIIEAIQTLLSTKFWSKYKKYYYWEIKVPNSKYMPFLDIAPLTSLVENRWTWGMANNTFQIQIRVVSTLKKYLKQNTNVQTLDHMQDLIDQVEWRNADRTLKSDSVLWVLHDNLQLSSSVHINGDWNVAYDEIELWESYLVYATIVFSANLITM